MITFLHRHSFVLGLGALLSGLLLFMLPFVLPTADIKQMQESTLRILCKSKEGTFTGSGFVVGTDSVTHIVTNDHVATCAGTGEQQILSAVLSRDDMIPLEIEWHDTDKDLAIVQSAAPLGRPAVRFTDTASVVSGAPVTVVGFPGAADQMVGAPNIAVPSVGRGNISRIVFGSNGTRYFQHTAPSNPGDSGGPVYDGSGNVIGVNSLKALAVVPTISDGHLTAGRIVSGEGIAAAVDAAEVVPQLDKLQVPYAMSDSLSAISAPAALVAAAVALMLTAAGIVVLTSSGRGWVLRRGSPAKGRDPKARGGRIRVLNGALAGTELAISAKVVLGRDPSQAQIVFPDDDTAVSRRHCEIAFDTVAAQFEVRDLKSRNGTFIAGEAGPPRRLRPDVVERVAPGNSILVGSSRNRLVLELA